MTVSGMTITKELRQPGHRRDRMTQKTRSVISWVFKPNRKRRHDGRELSELTGGRRKIDRSPKKTARGELEAPAAIDPERLQFRFTHRVRHDRAGKPGDGARGDALAARRQRQGMTVRDEFVAALDVYGPACRKGTLSELIFEQGISHWNVVDFCGYSAHLYPWVAAWVAFCPSFAPNPPMPAPLRKLPPSLDRHRARVAGNLLGGSFFKNDSGVVNAPFSDIQCLGSQGDSHFFIILRMRRIIPAIAADFSKRRELVRHSPGQLADLAGRAQVSVSKRRGAQVPGAQPPPGERGTGGLHVIR